MWNVAQQLFNNFSYEMSHHRTRPPTLGIQSMTRVIVVDNSTLGKEAHQLGRLPKIVHVLKQGELYILGYT